MTKSRISADEKFDLACNGSRVDLDSAENISIWYDSSGRNTLALELIPRIRLWSSVLHGKTGDGEIEASIEKLQSRFSEKSGIPVQYLTKAEMKKFRPGECTCTEPLIVAFQYTNLTKLGDLVACLKCKKVF